MVQMLVARGAKVDAADDDGETALMKAAAGGFADVVEALLAAGADQEIVDKGGKSARGHASLAGQAETLKLLTERLAK